tara:strand:- start:532 stop:825 length:294 start_codon:yes stop_codon:yes gene_type:complete
MNSNRGKERKIIEQVAKYLADRGSVPSPRDYNRDPNRPSFTTLKEINKYVGSWQILLDKIESTQPDLWKLAQPQAKPKIAPKAKAKPATKVASKKEK